MDIGFFPTSYVFLLKNSKYFMEMFGNTAIKVKSFKPDSVLFSIITYKISWDFMKSSGIFCTVKNAQGLLKIVVTCA